MARFNLNVGYWQLNAEILKSNYLNNIKDYVETIVIANRQYSKKQLPISYFH